MPWRENGGSAFPEVETDLSLDRDSNTDYPRTYSYGGMSLRDYFAAAAMGQMSRWHGLNHGSHQDIARDCYAFADAMLKEREK